MRLSFLTFILLLVFAGSVLSASLGDPFDGNKLQNPNWIWQSEPKGWDIGKTNPGWLHFVPGLNQNLWASDTSIRLYQETNEDFDVETHVVMDYKTDSIVSGLVALGPKENNWTTIKFWGRAADTILQWQHKSQEVVASVAGSSQPAGRVEVYIRMMKDGDNYMGWWKKQEKDDWIEIKPDAPIVLTPPIQIGIFGGICSAVGEATIEYEYFKDLINPYSVESVEKLSSTWAKIKQNN